MPSVRLAINPAFGKHHPLAIIKTHATVETILFFCFAVLLNGCYKTVPRLKDQWFETLKQQIEKNANSGDSVAFNWINSRIYERVFYKNGQIIKQEWYTHGDSILIGETLFGKDTTTQLRREVYRSGQYAYEGIHLNGKAFGPSTWWNEDGNIRKQGYRYNDLKVGVWGEWDENGKLIAETNHKKLDKLDSLLIPVIK